MKLSTKGYVYMILSEKEKEIIEALKNNDFVVGVNPRLGTYTTVIIFPDHKGDLVSSEYIYNIETYKTETTAKKLVKEIKELIKNDDRFKEYIHWNF